MSLDYIYELNIIYKLCILRPVSALYFRTVDNKRDYKFCMA